MYRLTSIHTFSEELFLSVNQDEKHVQFAKTIMETVDKYP